MKAFSHLALGFALTTLAVVIGVHLSRQATAAEAVDGLGTGLWFAALFLVGGRIGVHLGWHGPPIRPGQELLEVLRGVAVGALTWGLLWSLWALPQAEPLRGTIGGPFSANSLAMVAAALLATAWRHRSTRGAAAPIAG